MQEVLEMNFDNVTVHITVSRDHLLYCFKADTQEEFERFANMIKMKIDNELFKKVMKLR